jgi:hypothetical protein
MLLILELLKVGEPVAITTEDVTAAFLSYEIDRRVHPADFNSPEETAKLDAEEVAQATAECFLSHLCAVVKARGAA